MWVSEMKAVSFLLCINSVDLKLHGRDLYKVVEQEATGEGLRIQGEASSGPALGAQPGEPLGSGCVGSAPGGVLHSALSCLCYFLAGRVGAHRLTSLGLSLLSL